MSFDYGIVLPGLCAVLYHVQNDSWDVLRSLPEFCKIERIFGFAALQDMFRRHLASISDRSISEHFAGCVSAMVRHYKDHGAAIKELTDCVEVSEFAVLFDIKCPQMRPGDILSVGIDKFHSMLALHPDVKRFSGKNLSLYQAVECLANKPYSEKVVADLVQMIHLINQFQIPGIKEIEVSFVSAYYQRELRALAATSVRGVRASSTLFQPKPADACLPLPQPKVGGLTTE